jgi:myosin heavy subunit
VSRYKILLPSEQQDMVLASEQQTRAAVLQLLAVFKVPPGQYEMGRSKVFFKPGVLVGGKIAGAVHRTVHKLGTG